MYVCTCARACGNKTRPEAAPLVEFIGLGPFTTEGVSFFFSKKENNQILFLKKRKYINSFFKKKKIYKSFFSKKEKYKFFFLKKESI